MCSSLRRAVFLLPLILLTAPPAWAAPRWVPLGPFGGQVNSILVAPSDARVIYATLLEEGAFRSTDGGASWVPIQGTSVGSSVAVHPSRPGTVYALSFAGTLLKSTDFGSHWTRADRGLPESFVEAVAVDPARPSRLYAVAGVDLRVFRSTDGGASWKPSGQDFPPGDRVKALLALPRPAGTVFAIVSGTLYKSRDAGSTWKTVERGLPPGSVAALAVSPSEPWVLYAGSEDGRVFRSRNFGASWEATVRPLGSPVLSLAVSPRSGRTVWAGTADKGLFASFDGGAHWKKTGPPGLARITTVAVPPSSPRTVFVGTVPQGLDAGGVFVSEDDGATWTRRNRGLAGLEVYKVAAASGTPGLLWAALGNRGLFRSANGGQDWTLQPVPALRLALDPSSPSTLYASIPPKAWRTDDGGLSWSELPPVPGALCVDPASPATLWSYAGSLFKSVDGGATWVRQTLPGGGGIEVLEIAPSSPSTMYGAGLLPTTGHFSRARAWRSTDGGATWTVIDKGLEDSEATALAIDPVDPRLVYLATCDYFCVWGRGVWKSTDGGESWTLAGSELGDYEVSALAASPLAGIVWATGNPRKIFRSTDGGETWQERSEGLQAHIVYDMVLDPEEPRRVYVATSSGVWVLEDEP